MICCLNNKDTTVKACRCHLKVHGLSLAVKNGGITITRRLLLLQQTKLHKHNNRFHWIADLSSLAAQLFSGWQVDWCTASWCYLCRWHYVSINSLPASPLNWACLIQLSHLVRRIEGSFSSFVGNRYNILRTNTSTHYRPSHKNCNSPCCPWSYQDS